MAGTKMSYRAPKTTRAARPKPENQRIRVTKDRVAIKTSASVVTEHAGHTVPSKRLRITPEQITEMRRLQREGHSISAIARIVGCHRQSVQRILAEPKGDAVAEKARESVLAEEYRRHFEDLTKLADKGLRSMLDASPPNHEGRQAGERRPKGPISLGGALGLPHPGDASEMSMEWIRLYRPPSGTASLLRGLREHAPGLRFWEHFDAWRKKVAQYEEAGSAILGFVEDRTEWDLYEAIEPPKLEAIQLWAFGTLLRLAINLQPQDLQGFRKSAFDPKGVIVARDENADADGSAHVYHVLTSVLTEAQRLPEFETLKAEASELMCKETQLELRRIAREMDRELAIIELMHGLPGRCHLCPV
jgi:hypothetical protein